MASVSWSAEAIADLGAIGGYIGEFSPLAAQRMQARLRAEAENLYVFPERGRVIGRGRRVLAVVPPYLIIYRHDAPRVTILYIRHAARRPRS